MAAGSGGKIRSGKRSAFVTTFGILVDELPEFQVLHCPQGSTRRFGWTINTGTAASDVVDLPFRANEYLCICAPDDALPTSQEFPQASLAVVVGEDEPFDPGQLDEHLAKRALVLRDTQGHGLAAASARIQYAVHRVEQWNQALRHAVEVGRSIQDVVDAAEDLLGAFAIVTDSRYALVGYTRHLEPPEGFVADLVRRGYQDFETVEAARALGMFDERRAQQGVKLQEPFAGHPFQSYTYVFSTDATYYGHIMLSCDRRRPTPGLQDLFQEFVNACLLMYSRIWENYEQIYPAHFEFIERLMNDSRCSQSYVESHANKLGIPVEGAFQMMALDYRESPYHDQVYFLASRLESQFPDDWVFPYNGMVYLLVARQGFDGETPFAHERAYNVFCEQMGCVAFASDWFGSLRDLHYAYRQLRVLVNLRSLIDVEYRPFDNTELRRVFTFDGAFSYVCYSDEFNEAFKEFCLNYAPLAAMVRGASGSDVSDVRLLYYYLFNERRATPCAKQLNMHRNSVVYRIDAIQKRYGIDLGNFQVRERLYNTFRLRIYTDPTFRALIL